MALPNSNFGYMTPIDPKNNDYETLEHWTNSKYVHYYENGTIKKKKRCTPPKLDYSIDKTSDRLKLLKTIFDGHYTYFDKFQDAVFTENPEQDHPYFNATSATYTSDKIDVCHTLEQYADYLLFAPDAQPLNQKVEYKILSPKKMKEANISLDEAIEMEQKADCNVIFNLGNTPVVNSRYRPKEKDSEVIYFVERNENFYLENSPKIYKNDFKDKEIGKFLSDNYENIQLLQNKKNSIDKNDYVRIRQINGMIGTLKDNCLQYKIGIKRPIEMKKLNRGSCDIDWGFCNYWNPDHIKLLLRCPPKNMLTGLGEIQYDLQRLILKTKLTKQELKILHLWENSNDSLTDSMIMDDIANKFKVSQQYISKSIQNICNKICNTYNEQYEDWLNLNWIRGKYKKCSKCNKIKLISKFGKDNRNKNGLKSICKKCDSESRNQ